MADIVETAPPRSANRLLASLPVAIFEVLRPHLRVVELPQKAMLARAGDVMSEVWFPHGGIISLVVSLSEGEMVEVAMVGRDTAFGTASLHDALSLNDAIVQIAGAASVIDLVHFRSAIRQSPLLRDTLLRHEQVILIQAQQSAACNAFHTVEARLSRWLLRAHDLYDHTTLPLTQGVLAEMIGVRRNSVSLVANTLQQAGFVRYRRGRIEITNLNGLKETSCECYETVKLRCDRLLDPAFEKVTAPVKSIGRRPYGVEKTDIGV